MQVPTAEEIALLLDASARGGPWSEAQLTEALLNPFVRGLDRWALWTMIALVRHERRQTWVGRVVEDRLGGSLADIAVKGAFGHPDRPQSGVVPGLDEWEYYFHGKGCCLTHRVEGTTIDVDFDDGRTDTIDPYFYGRYLESLREPEVAEGQLACGADHEAWRADLLTLVNAGLVDGGHRVRLDDRARDAVALLEPLVDELSRRIESDPVSASAIALRLGDVVLAAEIVETDDALPATFVDAVVTASHVALERRRAKLRDRLATGSDDANVVVGALGALGREWTRREMADRLFHRPVDGSVNAAIDVVAAWNDPSFDETLLRALDDLDDDGERDTATEWFLLKCCEVLLRHQSPESITTATRDRLVGSLLGIGRGTIGWSGRLLYLLDPTKGLRRLAAAFDGGPADRTGAAAALAVIGGEPARRILLDAIESDDVDRARDALAALEELGGAENARVVTEWERRHPVPPPEISTVEVDGRTFETMRMEDMMRERVPERLRWEFDQLQDDFVPLLRRWRPDA